MRSKSNKRCRNINGQPFGTETPNNTQNSDSFYISALPDRHVATSPEHAYLRSVNNSANASSLSQQYLLDECQPSQQSFIDNVASLESPTKF